MFAQRCVHDFVTAGVSGLALRTSAEMLLGVDLAQDELRAAVLLAPARARVGADETALLLDDEVLGAVLLRLAVVEDGDVSAAALDARQVPARPPR